MSADRSVPPDLEAHADLQNSLESCREKGSCDMHVRWGRVSTVCNTTVWWAQLYNRCANDIIDRMFRARDRMQQQQKKTQQHKNTPNLPVLITTTTTSASRSNRHQQGQVICGAVNFTARRIDKRSQKQGTTPCSARTVLYTAHDDRKKTSVRKTRKHNGLHKPQLLHLLLLILLYYYDVLLYYCGTWYIVL